MKRYSELTPEQQKLAVRQSMRDIISGTLDGIIHVQLKNEMHHRFMERMFTHTRDTGDFARFNAFVRSSKWFKDEIIKMSDHAAQTAHYTEKSEYVIHGVADK